MIDYINAGAVTTLPFSSAVRSGEFLFISGQASVNADTGELISDSFAGEMKRAFDNLKRVLIAAGCTMENVVSLRCYVDKQENLAEYNQVYRSLVTSPYPARTTLIGVLGQEFLKFEVDAVATCV